MESKNHRITELKLKYQRIDEPKNQTAKDSKNQRNKVPKKHRMQESMNQRNTVSKNQKI